MIRVPCEVTEVELDADPAPVPGVCVTCSRCGHAAEVYGTERPSVRRGLVTLLAECPRGETNFYSEMDQE